MKSQLEQDLTMLIQNRVNEFVREAGVSIDSIYTKVYTAKEIGGKIVGSTVDIEIRLEDI
jgi:hypothetical protein